MNDHVNPPPEPEIPIPGPDEIPQPDHDDVDLPPSETPERHHDARSHAEKTTSTGSRKG